MAFACGGLFSNTCKLDTHDKFLVTGISNAFANAPNDLIDIKARAVPEVKNIDVSKVTIVGAIGTGMTIEQFTQEAFQFFMKDAIVSEKNGLFTITGTYGYTPGGVLPYMPCRLQGTAESSEFLFTDTTCLTPIINTINNYAAKTAANGGGKVCECQMKYLMSKKYKTWFQQMLLFVNNRFNQCVDNGYSTSACNQYRINDIDGYADYKAPPPANCPVANPGIICTEVNSMLVIMRLQAINSR